MIKIKKSKKFLHTWFVLLLLTIFISMPFSASAAQEEKMLRVGDTWEKDGWNLSVKAVDMTARFTSSFHSRIREKRLEMPRSKMVNPIFTRARILTAAK